MCLLFNMLSRLDVTFLPRSKRLLISWLQSPSAVILGPKKPRLWFFLWSCMDVSWTVKKAERRRIDAFELWCWRSLFRVPWTARWSNQFILKEISPGCSLEEMNANAETPIFWPPHVKIWLIGKDSDAVRDWGQEKGKTEYEMAGWHHWLNGHDWVTELNWTLNSGLP